jgi:hypothetical protein
MKVRIMLSSPASRHFLPLRFKYFVGVPSLLCFGGILVCRLRLCEIEFLGFVFGLDLLYRSVKIVTPVCNAEVISTKT